MTMHENRSPEDYAPTGWPDASQTPRPVLALSVDRACGWSVLVAVGEMDTACAGTLRSLLSRAGPNVVVDLRGVTFMDASGIGVLATSGHIARRIGGAVRLVGPSHQVRRVLALTQLDQVLPIYHDLQDALTAAA